VTIGSELLLGFTLDANGAYLARELAALGVAVARRTTVGDDGARIADAVREALERTGAVITTGGLGPTADDVTKPSIAAVFGTGMRRDPAILDGLRALWASRGWGRELPKANEQQALVPEGATILVNRHGTAPGFWLEDDRGWVAMLPGVPREMRGMFTDELLPRIRERLATAAGPSASEAPPVVLSRTLRTTGVSESALADAIAPMANSLGGVDLAYLPGWEGVDLRLTSYGRPRADAERVLGVAEQALRTAVGRHVYGAGNADLAGVVLEQCRDRGFVLAVAESCTGGLLGGRITAIPGSSQCFVGGVIAYANEVKATHLGVGDDTLIRFGAVSEETAREMASGVRARYRADVAMAVTGIAGPDGGTPEKPVGTVCVAVDIRGAVQSARRQMPGDRQEVRLRSTQWVLGLAWQALQP